MTVTTSTDGGGSVNNNNSNNSSNSNNSNNNNNNNTGRRVLMAKTDSLYNVNNNNNSSGVHNNNHGSTTSMSGKASVLSVRRVLFGPPAHPAETRAWLDRQLCAATAADSRSWNFDFVNERPLRDSPADRYAWERVCPPKRRDDADPTTTAQQQQRAGGECRRTAGKQQRQSKVTDFMSKIKKRPLSVAAGGCTLRSNKVLMDEPVSANKRTRRSVATTMMAI